MESIETLPVNGPAGDQAESGEALQAVGFLLGSAEYAIDIHHVVGVERVEGVLRLPKMPGFIEGVMIIRDENVPLIKLRARFGLESRPIDEQTRVVVVEGARAVGYIVDSITSVLRIPPTDVEAPPAIAISIESIFVKGIARIGGRRIIILDPREILRKGEEAQLAAAEELLDEVRGPGDADPAETEPLLTDPTERTDR